MIQATSSGMVAHSAVNPTDEIPVGPQVYPYGTPKLAESNVNPYLSTTYQNTVTAVPTATNVEVVQPVTTVQEVAVATPVVQTPVAAVQQVAVATPVVQTPVAAVQQVYQSPLLVSQIGYQKVMKYLPVAKTALVPRVTTSYATVPVGTIVGDVGTVVGNVAPAVAAPVVSAPAVATSVVQAPVVSAPAVATSVLANPVLTQSVVANPVLTQSVVAGPVVPPVLPQAGVALPDTSGHYVNGNFGR